MPSVSPAPLSAWMLDRVEERVAPAGGDQLLGGRRIVAGCRRRHPRTAGPAPVAGCRAAGRPSGTSSSPAPAPFDFAGVTRIELDVDADGRHGRVVDVTDELARDDRLVPTMPSTCFATVQVTSGTCPGTRPNISRSKSSTISGRRTFHHPPGVVTRCPFFDVSGSGKLGKRACLRFVHVCVVGGLLISTRTWSEHRDPELVEHLLMVVLSGPQRSAGRNTAGGRHSGCGLGL